MLISSGTYSWSCHWAPPANILQGFTGVTSFGLGGAAKWKHIWVCSCCSGSFSLSPVFPGQSRRSGSSQCPQSIGSHWDSTSHGHCTPQNHPKPSCNLPRSAPVLGGSTKSRVFNSSCLIPSASLAFPSDFSWSCVLPLPALSQCVPMASTLCPSHSFSLCPLPRRFY